MSFTSENIWQLDNVAVGSETYFFSFKLPWVPEVFFSRAARCFGAGRRSTHLRPKAEASSNYKYSIETQENEHEKPLAPGVVSYIHRKQAWIICDDDTVCNNCGQTSRAVIWAQLQTSCKFEKSMYNRNRNFHYGPHVGIYILLESS